MGDKKQDSEKFAAQDFCYDFPELISHRPDCERYRGGVCRPLPTPTKPYTPEEERVVAGYEEWKSGLVEQVGVIKVTGMTGPVVGEDDEVHSA